MIELTTAEINHLRRLMAWVRCEAGQTPEELMATVRKIAPAIEPVSDYAQKALVEMHSKSMNVPKYIWAAIKALERPIRERGGDIVDAENVSDRRFPERTEAER